MEVLLYKKQGRESSVLILADESCSMGSDLEESFEGEEERIFWGLRDIYTEAPG